MVVSMNKKRILILGAGVSGLAAAWYLAEKKQECKCTILEKSDSPGGWMGSVKEGDFLLEKGPRIFKTSRNESLLEIVSSIGFSSQLIPSSPQADVRYLWADGGFQKMPTGLLSLFRSSFCRPLLISLWRERKIAPVFADETIWDFACRRFGQIVAERFFDPLVLGIYAGDLKKLSVESCFPILKEWERQKGSIVKGICSSLQRKKEKKHPNSSLFSFKGGSQTLIQEWVSKIPYQINLKEDIIEIRKNQGVWEVETSYKTYEADVVISALPAYENARLLNKIAPKSSALFHSFEYQDVTSLHIGWDKDPLPFSAFGYLVPKKEKEPVLGVLFDSKMFKKEEGQSLLTAMIEGVFHSEVEMQQVGKRIIEGQLGIVLKPTLFSWRKMAKAIPQYYLGHLEKKEALVASLKEETQDFFIVGSYLDGVSVNDCIKSAKKKISELSVH